MLVVPVLVMVEPIMEVVLVVGGSASLAVYTTSCEAASDDGCDYSTGRIGSCWWS